MCLCVLIEKNESARLACNYHSVSSVIPYRVIHPLSVITPHPVVAILRLLVSAHNWACVRKMHASTLLFKRGRWKTEGWGASGVKSIFTSKLSASITLERKTFALVPVNSH